MLKNVNRSRKSCITGRFCIFQQLICLKTRSRRSKRTTQRQRLLLYQTIVPTDGHQMYRWLYLKSPNPQHIDVIKYQQKRLGTKKGFIAVKPNCSIQSYAPVLTAWKEFEPYEVVATTYRQSQSRERHSKTGLKWNTSFHSLVERKKK